MPKRKSDATMKQNGKKSFTDLFTMTDQKSSKRGECYMLDTAVESRKDVKMTHTNARTTQFEVEYNGKTKKITPGHDLLSRGEWVHELATFIDLKLNPPKEVYIAGWYAVTPSGDLTDNALQSMQKTAKRAYLGKTSSDTETDSSGCDND